MTTYIIKRILYFIPTFILISIIIFTVIRLPPGDPLTSYEQHLVTELNHTPFEAKEICDQIREWYKIGKIWIVEYFYWITLFLTGDFGYSFAHNTAVSSIIGERVFYSFLISIITLSFSWIIGIPIGILSAIKRYSFLDYLFTFLGFVGLAIPNFFLAILLLSVLWFIFGISPPSGIYSQEYIDAPMSFSKIIDLLKHLWLPVIVIGTAGLGQIIRIMRGNLLDILNANYVRTARAKGLPERLVINKHAVRIAINPLVSMLGMQIPLILSGEILGSIVLNLPTMGPLLYTSLIYEDFFLSGTILMFMSIFLVFGNLLADIILAWIDPRIRYDN